MAYHVCNVNFMSQYCFVNDTQISVYDYIKDKNNHKNKVLLCQQSHELILVNGVKRKPHFRHKHSEDVGGSPMCL